MENKTVITGIPERERLRKTKQGREIAWYNFDLLSGLTRMVLKESGLEEHVVVMTYGSAGGRMMVGTSDTDFTLMADGSLSGAQLQELLVKIYNAFSGYSWPVAIKAWKRVRVNPMDVMSLCFIGGNPALFTDQVVNHTEIREMGNLDMLVSTLAGVCLHLEFMASEYFSRLVRKYHPTSEFPVEISYGDVKYYKGGLRWIQQIYGIAMVLSGRRFLSDVDPDILTREGIFTGKDMELLNNALDFMLSAKDICLKGNNILYDANLEQLVGIWGQTPKEISREYDRHVENVQTLFYKASGILLKKFPEYEGALSVVVSSPEELLTLIRTEKLEIWKNIALRKDIPVEISNELRKKILERQQYAPHTMLDEMLVMLDYAGEASCLSLLTPQSDEDEEKEIWMTNQVFGRLRNILGNDVNQPGLIRYAIHQSFFELFREGKYPDPVTFSEIYLDRVRRFFHCSTFEPEQPVRMARSACEQILGSGLFHPENIMLLELHLTNQCNLDCSWCTYHAGRNEYSIFFEDLQRVVDLAPLEILIAGGGEPTLYREGEYGFNDVIGYLRDKLPGTRIRLITNGTLIPAGDWPDQADEISISLDEGDPEAYRVHKGKDLFDTVWENIKTYLFKTTVPFIRVTKIYHRDNLCGSIFLAEKLFELWRSLADGTSKKRYFSFVLFPEAQDENREDPYCDARLTDTQKEEWIRNLQAIRQEKPEFYRFLKHHTNLTRMADEDRNVYAADRCRNVANYLLLGADRKYYPCFASCAGFQSVNLGEAGKDKKELQQGRENLCVIPPVQCKRGCRPGSVFYGLKSAMIRREQERLDLSRLDLRTNGHRQVIHVACQDPEHLAGGIGHAVYNLCKAKAARGLQVCWLSPCIRDEREGEYLYENGRLRVIKIQFTDQRVETLFANDMGVHQQRKAWGDCVVKFIKKNFSPEYSVIHLHGFIETPGRSEELREAGFPVVSTFHMLLSGRNKALGTDVHLLDAFRELEKTAIGKNTVITVPSERMKADLTDICPGFQGKIHCIKNGIGEEHFTTKLRPVVPEERLIVSYGRISPEKGFELLIAAMKLLCKNAVGKEGRPIRCILFGNTDPAIEARRIYREQLIRSAAEVPGVKVLTTPEGLTGTAKLDIVDQALMGVIPSLYEPFGMVIPELMARGKPIITTLTDGAKDILQSSRTGRNDYGFIVDSTPEAIAEAMEWMLEHPDETAQMGRNALERAKYYRWGEVAGELEKVYREITGH